MKLDRNHIFDGMFFVRMVGQIIVVCFDLVMEAWKFSPNFFSSSLRKNPDLAAKIDLWHESSRTDSVAPKPPALKTNRQSDQVPVSARKATSVSSLFPNLVTFSVCWVWLFFVKNHNMFVWSANHWTGMLQEQIFFKHSFPLYKALSYASFQPKYASHKPNIKVYHVIILASKYVGYEIILIT